MLLATLDTSLLTILSFIAVGVLVMILMILFIISSKLSELSAKLSRLSPAAKPEEQDSAHYKATAPEEKESQVEVEVPAGTHFEEFLNEDPERRKLPKKEKFKAYRTWRTEKGLNWSNKD